MHVHKQQELHRLHAPKRQTTSDMSDLLHASVNIGHEMDLTMEFSCENLWTLRWFRVFAFIFILFCWHFLPNLQLRQDTTGQSRVSVLSEEPDSGSLVVLGFELHSVITALPLGIVFHAWCKGSDCLKIRMSTVVQWCQRLSWEHWVNLWNSTQSSGNLN